MVEPQLGLQLHNNGARVGIVAINAPDFVALPRDEDRPTDRSLNSSSNWAEKREQNSFIALGRNHTAFEKRCCKQGRRGTMHQSETQVE